MSVSKLSRAAFFRHKIAVTLVVFAQLPDAASLERTQAVVDKISKIAHETPGILNTVEFAGFNLFGGNQPNTAAVFLPFKEFSERKTREQSLPAILAKINARVRAEIPEALVIAFPRRRCPALVMPAVTNCLFKIAATPVSTNCKRRLSP